MKKLNKLEKEHKNNKFSEKKKRKWEMGNNVGAAEAVEVSVEGDNSIPAAAEKKKSKLKKNKRKTVEKNNVFIGEFDQLGTEAEDGSDKQNDDGVADQSLFETQVENEDSKGPSEADIKTKIRTRKSKKAGKKKMRDHDTSEGERLLEKREEAAQFEVDHISSGDEDCSKGMKKWIMEYHQSRPGLQVLQQRIDEFITAHETQLEQERKEREARAAEGGWTVVVHHKGRKKTTDAESGITVGSVAQAVVEDNVSKKKRKEVGLDFYRFQKREAQRNEIMMLQSKFEQDRKRIQQLRAARKFRPY